MVDEPADAGADTGVSTPSPVAAEVAVGAGAASEPVGMVLGTEDSTPLTFWVARRAGRLPPARRRGRSSTPRCPAGASLRISGIVQDVRARHEGASFDTDVFLVDRGVLPGRHRRRRAGGRHPLRAGDLRPAHARPAASGRAARTATQAMYFDQMDRRAPGGPVARRRAHVPGPRLPGRHARRPREHQRHLGRGHEDHVRAVPPLRAVPLLGPRGRSGRTRRPIVFNVKGEDLMWLDRAEHPADRRRPAEYERLGLPAGPFESVGLWAPPRPAGRIRRGRRAAHGGPRTTA